MDLRVRPSGVVQDSATKSAPDMHRMAFRAEDDGARDRVLQDFFEDVKVFSEVVCFFADLQSVPDGFACFGQRALIDHTKSEEALA